jgi:hypothetical protein
MVPGTVKVVDGLNLVVDVGGDVDATFSAVTKDKIKVTIDGNQGYLSQVQVGDRVECYGVDDGATRGKIHTLKVFRETTPE